MAAGFSHRFGGVKLQARLDNQQTVLQQTLLNLAPAVEEIVVVTRAEVTDFVSGTIDAVQLGSTSTKITCLEFKHPEQGMGATLAWGIKQLPKHWESCLVCLSDMPFIRSASYKLLVDALHQHKIVVPLHSGTMGNPAGFHASLFPLLGSLSGEQGGRKIIREYSALVHEVVLDDWGIVADIDTADDLRRYSALSTAP